MLVRSWITEWNDIIRNVIFKDTELRQLMELPEDIKIIDFIDRYFIRAGYTSKLLKDESVRIVYGSVFSNETDVPNIKTNEMSFDIYVRYEELHNVGNDRLTMRTQLIAARLVELLCSERYLKGYRFWVASENDLGTKTAGYARYNISFNYMKIY